MVFINSYGYNTWAKLAQVAAVGIAGKTTSDTHD